MKKKIKTREEWLIAATKELRPLFKKHKHAIPRKIMVGCGWPKGGKTETIGQCFGKSWTSNGTTHIFISPTQANNVEVLAILVHELIHAAVGCGEGHKGNFKKLALALGLEGKMTHTHVSKKSPLFPTLQKISKSLGKYPHSKMTPERKGKPSYVWPRLYSRTLPSYTFQMSPKLIKEYGLPKDPMGQTMLIRRTRVTIIRKAA